jgi:hypothetical protein
MAMTTRKPTGEYIIYREKGGITYSTKSIFWYCFYTGHPLPGEVPHIKPGFKPKWDVITYKGKVIG